VTILEVSERVQDIKDVPSRRLMAYVQDALNEIQTISPGESVDREFLNIVADTRYYSFPSTAIKTGGVFGKNPLDSTQWIRLPRIQRNDLLEDSSESTASSTDNLVII
jgi:hypothetical protein